MCFFVFFAGLKETTPDLQSKYFASEADRLENLTKDSGNLKEEKRKEMVTNLNIAKSFLQPNTAVNRKRQLDEL